jgi:hypothetical protein
MRIFSIIIHVPAKETTAMDATLEKSVLAYPHISYSIKKTVTRFWETRSYSCDYEALHTHEDMEGRSCFISEIDKPSSREWQNAVTPATDYRLSFT